MSIFVETFGDVFESLLACGVPDVEADFFVVDLGAFDFEVDADGGEQVGLVCVLAVAHQDAGFADARVADDEVLEGL